MRVRLSTNEQSRLCWLRNQTVDGIGSSPDPVMGDTVMFNSNGAGNYTVNLVYQFKLTDQDGSYPNVYHGLFVLPSVTFAVVN